MIEFFNYLNPILMCFASICWIVLYSKTSKQFHKMQLYNSLIVRKLTHIFSQEEPNESYINEIDTMIKELFND